MYPSNSRLNVAQVYLLGKAKGIVKQDPKNVIGNEILLFKEYLAISKLTVDQFREFDPQTKGLTTAFIKAMLVSAKASLGLYTKA